MTSQLLAALLLGVVLTVSADQNEKESLLRAFEISCKDCNTLQYGDGTLVEHVCPDGTLCGPVNGAFSCVPEAEAADCSCGGKENTYIPEPYDNTKYIACLPNGEQSTLSCATGEMYTGDIETPCAEGPKCDSAADPPAVLGFNAVAPECTQYFFCKALDGDATDLAYDCPEGQVYDTTMLGCVDPCTLAPEPFACEAGASGVFHDPEDCTIFHICFGGTEIGDPISCPDGQFFDVTADGCDTTGKAEDAVCTEQTLNVCYDHYKDQC